MSLEIFLYLAVLMLVCIGTYFIAGRLKVPYTVLLVVVGTPLVRAIFGHLSLWDTPRPRPLQAADLEPPDFQYLPCEDWAPLAAG